MSEIKPPPPKPKPKPKPKNIYYIWNYIKGLEVVVECTICDYVYPDKIKFKGNIDNLRCPRCINPVNLVYPTDLGDKKK